MANTFYITQVKSRNGTSSRREYVVVANRAGEKIGQQVGSDANYAIALGIMFRNAVIGDTFIVRHLSGSQYSGTVKTIPQVEAA